MMSMFALPAQGAQGDRSIFCRVLDGRELDGICPIDEAILTPLERAHYHHLRDARQRALAYRARSELKRMLGRELGLPPQNVPLKADNFGKPRCTHAGAEGLDFSVAHTDDCALIALGEVDGLGVDVEGIITEEPEDEMLEILFSDREKDCWRDLTAMQRRVAFTQAWTIKEAILKARGEGLSGSPHDVEVTFDEQGNAEPVFRDTQRQWTFQRINLSDRHAASLVAVHTPRPAWRKRY